MRATEFISEEWSEKYKRSINCAHPKGFSQKAHCAGRKKNEDLNEFAPGGNFKPPAPPKQKGNDPWGNDDRSKLLQTVKQLLLAGNKVDWKVAGQMGHVVRVNPDSVILKRWNKPYSKINYSLMLDDSDDENYLIRPVGPKHYKVVTSNPDWQLEEEDQLNEFAPGPDDNRENNPEDVLFRFAQMWYSAPDVATQRRVEQALSKIGWDIGELESEEGGAYVMQIGDDTGDSYIGWSEEQLADQLNELSFKGSPCTKDCSGHRAGYEWSQRKGGVDAASWSPSFNTGASLFKNGY